MALASSIGWAFGLAIAGFGVLTEFGTSKVVVLQFLMGFGALKVVGWGAVFDGVWGVEAGWSADLGVFGLFVVGSRVSMAFMGWRVAV